MARIHGHETTAGGVLVCCCCCCCCGLCVHARTQSRRPGPLGQGYVEGHGGLRRPRLSYPLTATERRSEKHNEPYTTAGRHYHTIMVSAADCSVDCPSVRAAKAVSLSVSRAPPLGMSRHDSASGAIVAPVTDLRRYKVPTKLALHWWYFAEFHCK